MTDIANDVYTYEKEGGISQSDHWSKQREKASGWQLKLLLFLFRIFPVIILRIIAFPVGFFYFLFSKKARLESKRFLNRIARLIKEPTLAKKCVSPLAPLKHIISFSLTLIEKIQGWGGRFPLKNIQFNNDDIKNLIDELNRGNGAFLVFSHLGNSELLRSLLYSDKTGVSRKVPAATIMDVKVTAHFVKMLKDLNLQSSVDIISTDDIGPQTAILLEEKLSGGGVVLIAGDRTSAAGDSNITLPFLGTNAPFPLGVFYLLSLINYPVYFIFGLRNKCLSLKSLYNMFVHKSDISFNCTRKERRQRSNDLAKSFVSLLESYCKKFPFQWFNFFDFWQEENAQGDIQNEKKKR